MSGRSSSGGTEASPVGGPDGFHAAPPAVAGARKRSTISRYAFAVGITLVGVGITLLLRDLLRPTIFLPYFGTVALAAWFGGRGPGVLAALLAILVLNLLVLEPVGSLRVEDPGWVIRAGLFLAVTLLITWLSDSLRRAQAKAEENAALAQQQAGQLHALSTELARQLEAGQALREELEQTNEFLVQAREQAERLARAREEILGIVAHEIRNPLNLITTNATLLLQHDLPPERARELIEVSRRAALRIDRLVSDLLDVTRMEAGQLSVRPDDVDPEHIARECIALSMPVAQQRRVQVSLEKRGELPRVRADADRLLQVLGNLMDNALKFTPEGGRITLRLEPHDHEMRFVVEDTGPGVSSEEMEQLFEPFWQGKRGDRRGAGLGLAIARGIAVAHGGRIWAESDGSSGSAFVLALPSDDPPATPG